MRIFNISNWIHRFLYWLILKVAWIFDGMFNQKIISYYNLMKEDSQEKKKKIMYPQLVLNSKSPLIRVKSSWFSFFFICICVCMYFYSLFCTEIALQMSWNLCAFFSFFVLSIQDKKKKKNRNGFCISRNEWIDDKISKTLSNITTHCWVFGG